MRAPLLDALLSYLQACRGPRIAHASADLFQAALSGASSPWQPEHGTAHSLDFGRHNEGMVYPTRDTILSSGNLTTAHMAAGLHTV